MKKFINKFLHLFELMRVRTTQKVVYLTFDDGPEKDVTDQVLALLEEYDAKATFFCRGDNAQANQDLLNNIKLNGHSIGNHTFSHVNGFYTSFNQYIGDIKRADEILHSNIFRPPWGSITLREFFAIRRKYRIVYWSLSSGDTGMEHFDLERCFENLKSNTRPGEVILFHCCKRHQHETMQILPLYLRWLVANGYKMMPL